MTRFFAAACAAVFLMAAPVQAQPAPDAPDFRREFDAAAREAAEKMAAALGGLMTRLSGLIDSLPSYEAPEILPNGDILIRRKKDAPKPEAKTKEAFEL